jgi:hypothetical protein
VSEKPVSLKGGEEMPQDNKGGLLKELPGILTELPGSRLKPTWLPLFQKLAVVFSKL